LTVVGTDGNPNGVSVQTFNTNAHLADLGFHLIVIC
jgi:hypothetical protein